MRFLRGLSGHSLENISGDRLCSVVIARKGIDDKIEDWGLYAFWRDSAIKQPLLTRSHIERVAHIYHPAFQREIEELMTADQDTIKQFCLELMESFCAEISSGATVINLKDVLEHAVIGDIR